MEAYKRVLVLAVGGGNDSVSTLLLQLQLHATFGYSPDTIDIAAVLPDCLSYQKTKGTDHALICEITGDSTRSVGSKVITAFPERILSQNKSVFAKLPVKTVYGLSMEKGSNGILDALKHLVLKAQYDLVLSIDVGGDFIADESNLDVLSPMMDGYMLYALKALQSCIKQQCLPVGMLFAVFGLGTDGESTPDMLSRALSHIPDIKTYSFIKEDVQDFVPFYRTVVEKNRYSRTTDFTLLEIFNEKKQDTNVFRGRFHIQRDKKSPAKVYYGQFAHAQDPDYYGKYYLFSDIDAVKNVYSAGVKSGLAWFVNVQHQETKINHELNGQSYVDVGALLGDVNFSRQSLFFCTPSRKFSVQQQHDVISDVSEAIMQGVYNFALIYSHYAKRLEDGICSVALNENLALVGTNLSDLLLLKEAVLKHVRSSETRFDASIV
jgi:hypothetical protein